ncbi:MAG: hypothetical protein C0613_10650 [Desulfobulbaceae bacterium]|nr:MAG: hypothetical protein C0613_10650 [Desulfobulbaceae bacterium]
MIRITTALFCLLLCLVDPAQAQNNSDILQEADALFHAADNEKNQEAALDLYRRALLRYEQVYESRPSGKLAYNIGNTYYRLGDLGRALVSYRRAEEKLAGNANLQHNLALVRSERRDQLEQQPDSSWLQRLNLHKNLSRELRSRILMALYVAFWLSAGLFYVRKFPMPLWLPGLLLLATLVASTSVGLDLLQPPARQGVIVAREIIARQGDGRNFQPAFKQPLHSGTEFVLLKKRGYWFHIELADGRHCWIPGRSGELI